MEVVFDPVKDATNRRKHRISLQEASLLNLVDCLVFEDVRFDYGEDRYIAIGPISGRVHVLVFLIRRGVTRPISLRKASAKEVRRYEQAKAAR